MLEQEDNRAAIGSALMCSSCGKAIKAFIDSRGVVWETCKGLCHFVRALLDKKQEAQDPRFVISDEEDTHIYLD